MLRSYEHRAPILGKIRLGVKKTSANGVEYPTTTEYFVLDSLPIDLKQAIEDIYGPEPKELDIIFPSDDESQIIPTWLKLYSGARKNDKGEVIGGKLRCYGDGPDKEGNPGVAVHLEKKDPITKIAPQRACLGPRCPDWKDAKGRQQCAQCMQVFCMLPKISVYGVFEIDTRSWYSIQSFHDLVNWVKGWNNGVIKGIPMKIAREEVLTTFTDPNGAQKNSRQFIMKLFPNEKPESLGADLVKKVQATFKHQNIMLPPSDELIERPAGMAFALEASPEEQEAEVVTQKIATAEEVVKDPEVVALFNQLETATGKTFTDKIRLVSVRKLEGAPDLKAAVVTSLNEKLFEIDSQKTQEPIA